MADTDTEEAAGTEGRTAYRLLTEALDELAAEGALPPEAVLLTGGPLRGLGPGEAEEAERRVVEAVERGLCGTSG
ncbi:hypothetical protein AB0D60_11000 [Streptomyces sp. NPDC048306]|uniref:hypothetical protein n=1 Tax=Streptomyces sp. NPDC048306 TaxID=3154502 RepID=UPI0033FDD39E